MHSSRQPPPDGVSWRHTIWPGPSRREKFTMKVRMPALLAAMAASVLVVGGVIVLAAPSSADDVVISSPAADAAAFTRVDLTLPGGEPVATFRTMTMVSSTERTFSGFEYPQSIVLTRAYGGTDLVHAWHDAVGGGDATQIQDFYLTLFDESGTIIGRYLVTEGYQKFITTENKRNSVERVEFPAHVITRIVT